jgi:phage shock protein A
VATTNKKADAGLLTNVKARKRVLEREATQIHKQIAKLSGQLHELQEKIDLLDKLISAEGPKKKTPKSAQPASKAVTGMAGRSPAAVKR